MIFRTVLLIRPLDLWYGWQVKSARSPYPAFGLTVAAGSATREKALKPSDKVGRVRLDLEMLYNSVSGCSPDDGVDAHGSPHGMVRGC